MSSQNANIFTMEETVQDMSRIEPIEGKQFLEDPALEKMAERMIDEHNIRIGNASLCYQLVYPNISKKTAAKCKKCSKELKHFSGYDFLIQISGELYDMLDADTRKMVLLHELMHINAQFKTKTREWKYSVRPHDYSDFWSIIHNHGTEWYETVQATVSSLYDLEPNEENKVKL